MDCKIPGRPTGPRPEINVVTYGLDGLTPWQTTYAHNRANDFLQKVMMDVETPEIIKEFLRTQNGVGMLIMQDLLAAFNKRERDAHPSFND